jgi:hypothetical protein
VSMPRFAYNPNPLITWSLKNCTSFTVNGGPSLQFVAHYPASWDGKDVVQYGPSLQPFGAFATHRFDFVFPP